MVGSKTNQVLEAVEIQTKYKGVNKTDILISCTDQLYIWFQRFLQFTKYNLTVSLSLTGVKIIRLVFVYDMFIIKPLYVRNFSGTVTSLRRSIVLKLVFILFFSYSGVFIDIMSEPWRR